MVSDKLQNCTFEDAKNHYAILDCMTKFTSKTARSTVLKTLEQNFYSAHLENILLVTLSEVNQV